jgi:hypothetical protein
MAKKAQSEISKALDKSSKLASQGKYDEAIKALNPYRRDAGVRKVIERTKGLKKAVKNLKSEKKGCWPFRG